MASLSSQQDLLDECHRSGQDLPPEIEQGNIEDKVRGRFELSFYINVNPPFCS